MGNKKSLEILDMNIHGKLMRLLTKKNLLAIGFFQSGFVQELRKKKECAKH